MGKKIALNTLYTVGVFIALIILIWGFQNSRYEFVMASILVGAILIALKIKLLKDVKNTINNKKP